MFRFCCFVWLCRHRFVVCVFCFVVCGVLLGSCLCYVSLLCFNFVEFCLWFGIGFWLWVFVYLWILRIFVSFGGCYFQVLTL